MTISSINNAAWTSTAMAARGNRSGLLAFTLACLLTGASATAQ